MKKLFLVLFSAALIVGVVAAVQSAPGAVEDSLHEKVQTDITTQYQLLVDSDAPWMDRCVRAGAVREAYLQGHDKSNFKKWSSIASHDCHKAGL